MAQYPAVIQLSSLNGTDGFQINGRVGGEFSGISVGSAGDVNGDGLADLIIRALPAGANLTASYVVFGRRSGFASTFNLATLNGSNGFRINGESVSDYDFDSSAASAGDINGDGFSDLILGAPSADPNSLSAAGASYVLFGRAAGFGSAIDLSTLNGANGFQINGEAAGDFSGISVASAGDLNADGYGDIIVGAYLATANGLNDAGASYVLFGRASGFQSEVFLAALVGNNGFQISGKAASDLSGAAVASAGDVNGDGYGDVVIGAPQADTSGGNNAGAAYVVFGKGSGLGAELNLAALNGGNGFQISGEVAGDNSGQSVASAGDVNGDGYGDLIIGAANADPTASLSGASYVVFGRPGGFPANLALSTLDGSNGFQINGELQGDQAGVSVAAAGDVNGDGFADLIIGAFTADPNGSSSGASYVVFGRAFGFAANLNLSSLDGTNGFQINGEGVGDVSGVSVASAGDVNGDGLADMIIGAPEARPSGAQSGASYVLFGREPDTAVTRTGSVIGQTLTGGSLGDTLRGLGGDDRLFGRGGDDLLEGGVGDDELFGGTGVDTAITTADLGQVSIAVRGQTVVISGPQGTDTLSGIERFQFRDRTIDRDAGDGVDDLFYLATYRDVAATGMDADAHFAAVGRAEGRAPNALFDRAYYLATNPDVAAAGIDPWLHFLGGGWQEGRNPSAAFNIADYRQANPDVPASVNPLLHYLGGGADEGRLRSVLFDDAFYLRLNPDVDAARLDPYVHWLQSGRREGRDPHPLFDADGYLATYPDVRNAGLDPLTHYLGGGWREGRDPSPGFDTSSYLAAYPDIAAAGINPLLHYLASGRAEGRMAFDDGVWG